ncbi:hypothetical protein N9B71_06040 [Pirellulales bacterium]|nr:hypothetical protein [Pirellulales bacterium]
MAASLPELLRPELLKYELLKYELLKYERKVVSGEDKTHVLLCRSVLSSVLMSILDSAK